MATKVYMEALSPTMEEGRLISWLKKEGDDVSEGDVIAEVETDKATMELVARGSGVMRKQIIGEGDTADVGSLIAVVAASDEDIGELVASAGGTEKAAAAEAPADEPEEKKEAAVATAEPPKEEKTAPAAAASAPAAPSSNGDRVKASPLARRLAEENGLEIENLNGSGPGGRIVKRDIEAALEGGVEAPAAAPAPVAAPAAVEGEYEDASISQMRKTIAKRLVQSIGPIPTFYLTVEIDMQEAMAFRKKINDRFSKEGIKVSPNDLIIKAVANALRKHPWVNSAWLGDTIRHHNAAHIGVAVAVEEGLITPVIRNADKKGITEIATEVRELAGRAREKKLAPEEYTGSTFSISNLGMFGIEEFTAIINPPEAAILAVGTVEDKVVAVDGRAVVRPRMQVTLSCDHRVIDGATGAEFLQTLKASLEDPMMMLA